MRRMEVLMNEQLRKRRKNQKCFFVGNGRDIPIPKRGALLGK
jgi:hypothetical protein